MNLFGENDMRASSSLTAASVHSTPESPLPYRFWGSRALAVAHALHHWLHRPVRRKNGLHQGEGRVVCSPLRRAPQCKCCLVDDHFAGRLNRFDTGHRAGFTLPAAHSPLVSPCHHTARIGAELGPDILQLSEKKLVISRSCLTLFSLIFDTLLCVC